MVSKLEQLREVLKDSQEDPELVLQVLLEQGWIKENGTVGDDLVGYLDTASDFAFNDPFGDIEDDI